MPTAFIQRDQGGTISGTFCRRCDAVHKCSTGERVALSPLYRGGRESIAQYAVALLCCDLCGDNLADAGRGEGAPPYDAATATGMYDRNDV